MPFFVLVARVLRECTCQITTHRNPMKMHIFFFFLITCLSWLAYPIGGNHPPHVSCTSLTVLRRTEECCDNSTRAVGFQVLTTLRFRIYILLDRIYSFTQCMTKRLIYPHVSHVTKVVLVTTFMLSINVMIFVLPSKI